MWYNDLIQISYNQDLNRLHFYLALVAVVLVISIFTGIDFKVSKKPETCYVKETEEVARLKNAVRALISKK